MPLIDPDKPAPWEIAFFTRAAAPWRLWTRPCFFGMENVPADRPLLFIGNHSLFAFGDAVFLYDQLYRSYGIYLRALGDRAHRKVPLWGAFVRHTGMMVGSHENADRLLSEGNCVLTFPGGGREAFKRRGENNRTIWKERVGFARVAIRHRCLIVPFSSVGADEFFTILADMNTYLDSPLGPVIKAVFGRDDILPPLVRGIGPTLLPRRERVYIRIGKPIDPTQFGDDPSDHEAAGRLRDRVRAEVDGGIAAILDYRKSDPVRAGAWTSPSFAFHNELQPDLPGLIFD